MWCACLNKWFETPVIKHELVLSPKFVTDVLKIIDPFHRQQKLLHWAHKSPFPIHCRAHDLKLTVLLRALVAQASFINQIQNNSLAAPIISVCIPHLLSQSMIDGRLTVKCPSWWSGKCMNKYSVATSCIMESPRNSILWLWPLKNETSMQQNQ